MSDLSSLEKFINSSKLSLTKTDLIVCDYLIKNLNDIPNMTLLELASETYSSKSNILRLLKKLGFTGFTDFKYFLLAEETNKVEQNYFNLILKKMESIDTNYISDKFNEMVLLSDNIYIFATGREQEIQAQNLENYLLKAGFISAVVLLNVNSELTNVVISSLKKDDLIIIFSSKGDNDSIKLFFEPFTKENSNIITFTGYKNGWIQERAKLPITLEMVQLQDSAAPHQAGMIHLLLNFLATRLPRKN